MIKLILSIFAPLVSLFNKLMDRKEREELKDVGKTEAERDQLADTLHDIRVSDDARDRLRSDPAWRRRVRDIFTRKS